MNKIIISELTKSFKNGKNEIEVFNIKRISFEENKTYAIKGSSGSGKSTFLQIIAGLDVPTNGSVCYEGDIAKELVEKDFFDIHKSKDKILNKLRKNSIGFIYQRNFLLKDLTVIDNLLIANRNKQKASELLSSVGLESRKYAYYSELSGGERQRVSICRALMNSPKFIFADEPTGSLDFHNKEKIWTLLMELKELHNFGLIMVTHDNDLANACDHVFNLKEGKLISDK